MQVKHIIYNIAISANCNYVCFDYTCTEMVRKAWAMSTLASKAPGGNCSIRAIARSTVGYSVGSMAVGQCNHVCSPLVERRDQE